MAVHPLTNVMPGVQSRNRNLATGVESAKAGDMSWAVATYDFAVDGGAVGTIALLGTTGIPSGAIILDSVINVLTALTSGGAATVALQVEAAGDVVASATAISGAPWSTTGRKSGIPVSAATSLKTTAARDISMVIATAALTAGKFEVYLRYIDPTANY